MYLLRKLALILFIAIIVASSQTIGAYGVEFLDRGVVALSLDKEHVYVGWRFLKDDPEQAVFNVYRQDIGFGQYIKINKVPVEDSTNFIDNTTLPGHGYRYKIKVIVNKKEAECAGEAYVFTYATNRPWVTLALNNQIIPKNIGFGDLEGDGALDFVLQHPDFNVRPLYSNWERSPVPYKLDAYSSKGKFLWRYNMGWSIETGTWYAPYLVYDVDMDGRAEVYVKAGEDDPREIDGHVLKGTEFLQKIDGLSGNSVNKTEWISRDGFKSYNYWSRNFLAVAYLDGVIPSLIMHRGTYGLMKTVAVDANFYPIWTWASEGLYEKYKGQGGHSILTGDIDQDGKDELVIGTTVLDDSGIPLWYTDLGHNDAGYIADIDPNNSGYEIFYGIENKSLKNGVCLVDAESGKILWGYQEPTRHVHGRGMIGDFTDEYDGIECYSGEKDESKFFFHTGQGKLVSSENRWGLFPFALWWDADPQKEIIYKKKIVNYDQQEMLAIEGKVLMVADILGDWREEIITSLPGEVRIYSTNILAHTRKTCLLQNHLYRMRVANSSSGYFSAPQVGFE